MENTKNIADEIKSYENEIEKMMRVLRNDFQNLNDNVKGDLNLGAVRKIAGRINDYCNDVLAYQEKISFLKKKMV
jgi:uncharacterized protein Yka (UPF0111/DUF47 family)